MNWPSGEADSDGPPMPGEDEGGVEQEVEVEPVDEPVDDPSGARISFQE